MIRRSALSGLGGRPSAAVAALHRLRILDSDPESAFDRIVKIASRAFGVRTVLISLLDLDRQWFKARVGTTARQTDLNVSFCRHAVREHRVMVVPDATRDARFRDNPLVTAPEGIRFYAGAPLVLGDGHAVGTLCLIDPAPRHAFSAEDAAVLEEMAALVVELLEGRSHKIAMEEAKAKLEDFTSSALDIFWETDAADRFTHIAVNTEGADPDEAAWAARIRSTMLGRTRLEIEGADPEVEPWATYAALIAARRPLRDLRYAKQIPNGTIHLSVSGKPTFDAAGNFMGYRGATHDVTAQEEARLEALRLAHSDALTDLANRRRWNDVLEGALNGRDANPASVLLLDVDRFKDFNDALGYASGDSILVGLARRLEVCASAAQAVARLGGDEFAILVPGSIEKAKDVADCVLTAMARPIVIEGQTLQVQVSIGIKSVLDGETSHDVMLGADLALRAAKDEGRARCITFEPIMRADTDRRVALISQFSRALEANEFELHYQPQLRLSDGAIIGMEALLRWRHPERGLLTPFHFLDALETSSFEIGVGRFVIEEACRQASAWRRLGQDVQVGVNVSAGQVYGDDLSRRFAEAGARHGLPLDLIEAEVTERVALGDAQRVCRVLGAIRELGVLIAFDDFGTGYASLSSLTRYPIDRVKIDRSFVSDIGRSGQNARLTASLLRMCQGLNLRVIAEGVEAQDQEAFLRLHRCDEVQGYYYARPMGAEEATSFLRTHRRLDAEQSLRIGSA